MKNTDEQKNPNADLTAVKRSTYWCCEAAEGRRSLSDQEQVDAAALLMQCSKDDGGGGARALRGREEEEEMKRQGGEWKGPPVLFIKAKG